jgi:tRNA A-37 threonylcarbamoyl transferase component Bud32
MRADFPSGIIYVMVSSSVAARCLMLNVKDTLRATVNLSFDGRVIKVYHGPDAQARFTNEVRLLRHLEARGCGFVPRLIEVDPAQPAIVTTNCGTRVEHLDDARAKELFSELEQYGVRHDDPDIRNVTYRQSDGRFCLIDFELATILPGFESAPNQ